MELKTHMDEINSQYMQSSDAGFQAWCADIHALVWNLWRRNMKTECPEEFNFAWATDKIEKIQECKLFHNAGVTSESIVRTTQKDENGKTIFIDAPCLYKGKFSYISEQNSPFDEPELLNSILQHPISKTYCTAFYVQAIKSCRELYNL